ncbi:hypothetical protein MUB24_13490 [Lederbergia sp. NSJ-179]|uniref:hypothetical protein n=1 Tax=Lederbergia sp. NSJ-179 TaxID=2931402 RepID=UPI001FD318E5|nr:hypothetical protein [Lederbergia sp. NSJ-179]MCJ7841893.1 hypothetical protein [Lederbergia sp. NSJ-179]
MEKIVVDSYNLDKISTRMAKDFGTIAKGQEEHYTYPLAAMEGNLLKLHRQDPNRTDREALTAIRMALLTIDGYIKQVEYDFSDHVTLNNKAFLHGLLMSFDPYTNKEVREVVMEDERYFDAKKYYAIHVKCLLRIEKSIKLWIKRRGSNGYFTFIENHMGHMIERDEKMNFSVLSQG